MEALQKAVYDSSKWATGGFLNLEDAKAYALAEFRLAVAIDDWSRVPCRRTAKSFTMYGFRDTVFTRVYKTGYVAIPAKYCYFDTTRLDSISIGSKYYYVVHI